MQRLSVENNSDLPVHCGHRHISSVFPIQPLPSSLIHTQFKTEVWCLFIAVSFQRAAPTDGDQTASAHNWMDAQPATGTKQVTQQPRVNRPTCNVEELVRWWMTVAGSSSWSAPVTAIWIVWNSGPAVAARWVIAKSLNRLRLARDGVNPANHAVKGFNTRSTCKADTWVMGLAVSS